MHSRLKHCPAVDIVGTIFRPYIMCDDIGILVSFDEDSVINGATIGKIWIV